MDTNELKAVLKQIGSLAEQSADDSELQARRLKEAEGLLNAATEKCEQATHAFSSWRLLRYFRLRRQQRKLIEQALALIEVPKEMGDRTQAAIISAKALGESARRLQ